MNSHFRARSRALLTKSSTVSPFFCRNPVSFRWLTRKLSAGWSCSLRFCSITPGIADHLLLRVQALFRRRPSSPAWRRMWVTFSACGGLGLRKSRSVYSRTCYAYRQGFLPCLFLLFRFVHLHFFPKPLPISPVLAVANTWFLCRPAE